MPAAEEKTVSYAAENSSVFRLESGDGSRTFRSWRQRVPDSWCRDTEHFGLEVDHQLHD